MQEAAYGMEEMGQGSSGSLFWLNRLDWPSWLSELCACITLIRSKVNKRKNKPWTDGCSMIQFLQLPSHYFIGTYRCMWMTRASLGQPPNWKCLSLGRWVWHLRLMYSVWWRIWLYYHKKCIHVLSVKLSVNKQWKAEKGFRSGM